MRLGACSLSFVAHFPVSMLCTSLVVSRWLIDLESDQLTRELGPALRSSFHIPPLDLQILALDVSVLAQSAHQAVPVSRHLRCRGRNVRQEAEPVGLPSLLRVGDERRDEGAEGSIGGDKGPLDVTLLGVPRTLGEVAFIPPTARTAGLSSDCERANGTSETRAGPGAGI
jgi:hypothetical protein